MNYLRLAGASLLLLAAGCRHAAEQAAAPIRIRWNHDPGTLDPLNLPDPQAIEAANLLHLSLLQIDYQDEQMVPGLARALPTVQLEGDSVTRLTFEVRPEARWDDGQPVLATDVAFTLKLLNCPGLPNEGARLQLGFIEACELDPAEPRRLTFRCRGLSPDFPRVAGDFAVLKEAALDAGHALRAVTLRQLRAAEAPAQLPAAVAALVTRYQQADLAHHPERLPGCGGYQLSEWKPDRSLTFTRKANWWADQVKPTPRVLEARPERVRFVVIPDDAAAGLALRRGEVDVLPQVPPRLFDQLQHAPQHERLTFYTGGSFDVVTAGFNTRHPDLQDAATRRALSRLFDPASLNQATQLGQGKLTASLLSAGTPYYNASLPLLTYDPAATAAGLRQAGWQQRPGGWYRPGQAQPLHLALRYRLGDQTFAAAALQFQTAAARLAIPVELRPTEPGSFGKELQGGQFDVYLRILKGSPFAYNFSWLLHSQSLGADNVTGYHSPELDKLLTAIETADPAHKRALLLRFQELVQQQAPVVGLFSLPGHLVTSRRLQPVTLSRLKPGYAAATLSWQPAGAGTGAVAAAP